MCFPWIILSSSYLSNFRYSRTQSFHLGLQLQIPFCVFFPCCLQFRDWKIFLFLIINKIQVWISCSGGMTDVIQVRHNSSLYVMFWMYLKYNTINRTPRLSGIQIHPLPELYLNISRLYTNSLIKCYNTRTVAHSYYYDFYNYNRTKTNSFQTTNFNLFNNIYELKFLATFNCVMEFKFLIDGLIKEDLFFFINKHQKQLHQQLDFAYQSRLQLSQLTD